MRLSTTIIVFALLGWGSFAALPAHAQTAPQNATVSVTDTDTSENIVNVQDPTTTAEEGTGDSVNLSIALDQATDGDVTITVFESASEPTITRSSNGQALIESQCTVRLANTTPRLDSVSFTLNTTTPQTVIIEPRDDAFLEGIHTEQDPHYCNISVTRSNPGENAAQAVVVYRINLDDTANDTDTVNLLYLNDVANEGEPPIMVLDDDKVTRVEVIYLFTRTISESVTFTFASTTPNVCTIPSGFMNFDVSAIPANQFFALPVDIADVDAASQCTITGTWSPVPTGYPAQLDLPDTSFLAQPISPDVNGDGLVTPSDAIYVINRIDQPVQGFEPADLNQDGMITEADVTIVTDAIGESIAVQP